MLVLPQPLGPTNTVIRDWKSIFTSRRALKFWNFALVIIGRLHLLQKARAAECENVAIVSGTQPPFHPMRTNREIALNSAFLVKAEAKKAK